MFIKKKSSNENLVAREHNYRAYQISKLVDVSLHILGDDVGPFGGLARIRQNGNENLQVFFSFNYKMFKRNF